MKKRDNIIYRESQHFRTAKSFGNHSRKRVFKTLDLECKCLGVKGDASTQVRGPTEGF